MLSDLEAFVAVSLLVIVTPGPDTALTIRNALTTGRRGGLRTALGVSCGQAAWTVATSVGVAALLVASEAAFTAVKVFGAAYLCYLGGRSVLAVVTPRRLGGGPRADRAPRDDRSWAPFRQGLISNLSNPKMAIFFPSLLPQFTAGHETAFVEMAALGTIFCALTLAWLSVYAIVVAKAGDALRRPRVSMLVESLMGLALIGLGVRLLGMQR